MTDVMRRSSILAALATVTLAMGAVGCSSDDGETSQPEPSLPGPEEWNRDVTAPPDDEAESKRLACAYEAGSLPEETQGASHPNGDEIPIDHVLIVMMENRSFDHYFQKLPEYGQPDVDVAPEDFENPDPDGNPVGIFHDESYCFVDTAHGYTPSHRQVNGGAMDGFVITNEGNHELPAGGTLDMLSGSRAMGWYDETDLPFYYWLASEFSIADRYFASVLGPTWPNRMYLFAATSYGLSNNTLVDATNTIQDYLDLREVSWKLYSSTTATYGMFLNKYGPAVQEGKIVGSDEYFSDLDNGTLPQVAFVEPGVGREAFDANDEHPPAVMQLGQEFVAQVIDALAQSSYWDKSALFLTYDEHGGTYDHVVPPDACAPDDLAEPLDDGSTPTFANYGIRVPFMVISPYAKKHFVSHRTYDHTSILRFVEARFVMPALTGRDANAEAPWDMFDFDDPPHLTPPAVNMPPVDEDVMASCAAIFDE